MDSYKDFEESPFRIRGNMTVPVACCVLVGEKDDPRRLQPKDPRCPYSPSEGNSYYKTVSLAFDKLFMDTEFVSTWNGNNTTLQPRIH